MPPLNDRMTLVPHKQYKQSRSVLVAVSVFCLTFLAPLAIKLDSTTAFADSLPFPTRPKPRSQPVAANPTHLRTVGWGIWQPIAKLKTANISSGFSNMELGGFLDFQNACATATGQPMDAFPNWFRLSNLVSELGTGEVEYGCWVKGEFVTTIVNTAVQTDLPEPYCLQLRPPVRRLSVFDEPNPRAKRIGQIRSSDRLDPGTSPALITETNGQYWVAIQKPIEGWVLHGRMGQTGNLRRCP